MSQSKNNGSAKPQPVVICLANQKGGVGKTTSTAALSVRLVARGFKVLVVDGDPQGHLSLQFGIDPYKEPDSKGTVADLYINDKINPRDVVRTTRFEGVSVIPASVELARVEIILPGLPGADLKLGRRLDEIKQDYDIVLIDAAPNLGKLTINALSASDYYLVPMDGGTWSLRSVDTIVEVATENTRVYRLGTKLLGIFITMADRTRLLQSVAEEAQERYPQAFLETRIRRSNLAREAAALETPLPLYAKDSGVAADYEALTVEVLKKIGLKKPLTTRI